MPCRQGAVTPSLAVKKPSAVSTDDSGHLSRPPKALVRLLVVALPLLTPPPPICRRLSLRPSLFVPLVRFSRRHLSSAGASASHRVVASSCHTHLVPLVRLVKVSPLLTLPPPICGIIKSSLRNGLMLV